MDAFEKIKRTIEERELIRDGDRVVVGFSGGPDSLCLLHCLWRLSGGGDAGQRANSGDAGERDSSAEPGGTANADPGRTANADPGRTANADPGRTANGEPARRWDLWAVHVNHQLRGEAADADQAFAEEFCRERNIPCTVYRFDVREIAEKEGCSEEDAGRRVRYGAFHQVRGRLETEKHRCLIAVAQNANDQAETVLMRVMRGTGLVGLGAMDYSRKDGVIRPLLDVTRAEVEEYCTAQGLRPRIDLTNLEPDYTRNRIRLELLPYMQIYFNENIVETLNRLASIARGASSYIDDGAWELIGDARSSGLLLEEKGRIELPASLIRRQPPALRHRVVTLLLAAVGLEQNISAAHLEQADHIAMGDMGSATALFPGGYRVRRSYGQLIFESPERADATTFSLEWEIVPAEVAGDPAKLPPDQRAFDRAAVESTGKTPVLRTRRPGDYIRPFGMKGSKKLQDFFVDRKVPRELRDTLPLVCLGSEVIWVPGPAGTTGDPYRITKDTREALILRMIGQNITGK